MAAGLPVSPLIHFDPKQSWDGGESSIELALSKDEVTLARHEDQSLDVAGASSQRRLFMGDLDLR